ncbi:MAG: hypothetical protein ACO1SX_16595 [Actinomycetota bacterium]
MTGSVSPWKLGITALLLALAIPSGYSTMNFILAESPEAAAAKGRSMPAHWEAGVWNHGRYMRWYRIESHPWLFGAGCLGLIAAAGVLLLAAAGSNTPEAKAELERLQREVESLRHR